jgi:hypothetical protein
MRLAGWLSCLGGGAALVLAVRLAQGVPGPWQAWIGTWAPLLLLVGVVMIVTGLGGLTYDAWPYIRERWGRLPIEFRSPIIRKGPPKPRPVLAPRGMWDFRRDGDRAMNTMTATLKRIVVAMQRSTKRVNRHAKRMNAAAAKPNPSVEKGYKLGKAAAADMTRHAKTMEGLEATYRTARIVMTENFLEWFKGYPAGTDLSAWATNLREIAETSRASVEGIGANRQAAQTLRNQNINQPFNQATERQIAVLTWFIEDIENTEKFCQESLGLLDDKGIKKP